MRNFRIILSSVSMLAVAAPALAQEAQPAGDGMVETSSDIIVTARRRDESVQEVPQTVNVVTADQVEKLNIRNFQEIQSLVPGLTMTQTSSFSSQATVRGIAFVPEASGNNPSVEFYLNDAPISSGFLFQSTYDFGQFELQRGPQGTLRGRASPSGSIAVTVRRPDLHEVGVVMNGTATDQHAYKLDGAINIPLVPDILAIRLAGVVDENRGSFTRSIKRDTDPAHNRNPYRETQSFRGTVRFEPADWLSANLMYQSLHSESHSYGQVASDSLFDKDAVRTTTLIKPFDRLSIDDVGNYDRQDHDVLIGNVDARFAGQVLSYVGSYNKQDFASLSVQDNADVLKGTTSRRFSDPAGFAQVCTNEGRFFTPTNGQFYQCTHGVGKRETHELRLASEERIAGILDYVLGGFYDHNKNPTDLTQELPIPPSGTIVARTPIGRRGTSTEKSVFGNLTAHLLDDRLELSGGLRYIKYKNDNSLLVSGAAISADADDDDATIYMASAKYKISDNFMIYALTGSSWRPGPRAVGNFSLGGLPDADGNTPGLSPRELQYMNLPPEKSKSYEIGFKSTFLDGRGRFNLSAYHQDFKNYPFRGPAVLFQNFSRNRQTGLVVPSVGSFNFLAAVPVDVNGIEAEASYQIMDRWTLGVNAAYANGKIKNGTIACTDLNGDGIPDSNPVTPATVAGLNLPAGQNLNECSGINRPASTTAKFNANIQTEYDFDFSNSLGGFVRALINVTGSTDVDPDNPFDDVGSYGLLNMFTGIRDPEGSWELTLFAKNLLNEKKVLTVGGSTTTTSFQAVGLTVPSEYRAITVTAPREFGITGRFAFGSR